MNRIGENVVTVLLAIVTVAMLAVLVSRKAQTPQIISAGGGAFAEALSVAESPVESPGMASFGLY